MTSNLQSTGQAPQDAATSEQPADAHIQGITSPPTIYEANMEAAPAVGVKSNNANDSGFFEGNSSNNPEIEYTDFQLFSDNLPDIDPAMDQFWADADAVVQGSPKLFDNDISDDSGVELDIVAPGPCALAQGENTILYNTMRDVILNDVSDIVYEIVKDFSADTMPANIAAAPVLHAAPILQWISTYHRHEDIAYLHEQSPYPIFELEQEQQ